MFLNVKKNSKQYCHKSIGIGIGNTVHKQYWYWHRQHFLPKYCYWYWQ